MSENTQNAAAEAAEEPKAQAAEGTAQEGNAAEVKMFTQEQVDEIVTKRLARAKATPPADYEELKAKAAKYDEAQEAAKSDLQKATERADKAEAELESIRAQQAHDAAVKAAAEKYGVDSGLLSRMAGDIEENAAYLQGIEQAKPKVPAYPKVNDPGEIQVKAITREDIEAIKDPVKRVRERAKHIDLYQ